MFALFAIAWMFLLAQPVHAVTYYVATTGSDANSGTSPESPWLTIQKCFASGTPLTAGDTCEVANGTYTTTATGRVVVIGSSSPQGTVNAPITLKATNPLGATIEVPNSWPGVNCSVTGCPFTGVVLSGRNYYIIEGFQFTRPGSFYAAQAATAGVSTFNASNIIIRNNHFHDIGRTVCNDGVLGQGGIYSENTSSLTVENNIFNAIGRRRNGESGCTTTIFHHDHGAYINGSTDFTFRRNICYDVNRGFCVNIKSNAGVAKTLRAKIYHNTFSGAAPGNNPLGTIALTNLLDTIDIQNNIFHDVSGGSALWWYTSSATTGGGVILSNNTTNVASTDNTFSNPSLRPASLITNSGNTYSQALNFVNAGANDYRLNSTSSAIGAGATLSGFTYNGAPDIGAYETFVPVSASITNTTVSVTLGMALNTPVVASSGATGWSISCTVSCGTLSISGVSLKSGTNSILDITVSGWTGGQCAAGQTITVSFDPSTGAVRDSATIANTHQRLNSVTSFAVTNNCTGSPPAGPPGGSHVYYPLEGNANDSSGGGRTGTATGGSFAGSLYGQGYQCSTGVDCYVEAPYGNTINPSTQSLTMAYSVNIPASDIGLQRTYMGTSLGTNQRLHTRTDSGTWRFAIQGDNGSTASDLAVVAGWNRVCLRFDSATDTMTPYVNGVAGTGAGSVKSYTPYALASNLRFGLPNGHNTVNAGQGLYDQILIWTSLVSCVDDWIAWNSASQPTVGTFAQVGYRLQFIYHDPAGNPTNYKALDTPGEVVSPGAVSVVFQVNCTVANCTPSGLQLRYSLDGVNFNAVVPDSPTADGISMWGSSVDTQLNRFSAGSALSAGLTHTAGGTVLSTVDAPTVSLNSSNSLTLRYIVKVAPGADGKTFYLKLYRQDGSALSSYSPTTGAQFSVVKLRAGGP